MVYRDISQDVELNEIGHPASSADLLDRFFSFLIDYFVISPFVMFFLYITLQNGFYFLKMNPLAPENALFQMLAAVCYVLLFALVQTCFVGLWKATPGQYFLKLRFETDQSMATLQFRVFFRQILVWVSFLFLGLPFLSMLTNKKRRTFYDQMADVSVVTSKKDQAPKFSFEIEHKYWQALLVTLSLFLGSLFVALLMSQYSGIVNRVASFKEFQNRSFFCTQLNQVDQSERLETAIALNLVDQLSDECLDREADFVLWRQKEKDMNLAYWAKSLTAREAEKEKQYQQKVCQSPSTADKRDIASQACDLSQAFTQNKFAELIPNLREDSLLGLVLKYELIQIVDSQTGQAHDTTALLGEIEKYRDIKPVRKYLITEMLSTMPDERAEAATQLAQTEEESTNEDLVNETTSKVIANLSGAVVENREPASTGEASHLSDEEPLDSQVLKRLPSEDGQKVSPVVPAHYRKLTPTQLKTEKIIELMGDL